MAQIHIEINEDGESQITTDLADKFMASLVLASAAASVLREAVSDRKAEHDRVEALWTPKLSVPPGVRTKRR